MHSREKPSDTYLLKRGKNDLLMDSIIKVYKSKPNKATFLDIVYDLGDVDAYSLLDHAIQDPDTVTGTCFLFQMNLDYETVTPTLLYYFIPMTTEPNIEALKREPQWLMILSNMHRRKKSGSTYLLKRGYDDLLMDSIIVVYESKRKATFLDVVADLDHKITQLMLGDAYSQLEAAVHDPVSITGTYVLFQMNYDYN